MTDDLSKNSYPKLALPIGKIKIPKFLYIILIGLIILILVVGGLYFYLENSKKIINQTNESVYETNASKAGGSNTLSLIKDTSEISNQLINWSNKQRDDRGVYSESEFCKNDVCSGNSSSNRSGFSVMDGKVRYENKIDQSVVDDLKKYADRNIVQVIQNNYLLCNFLYDLYNYPNASEEVKTLTKKICFDVQYEFDDTKDFDLVYFDENIVDVNNLLNQNLQKLEKILIKKETVSSSSFGGNFDITRKYGYFVSEFATRYKWEGKDMDYKGFIISLDRFLDLYIDQNNEFKEGELCGLAWGLIDMGEYKQIPELKKYGEMIYSKEVIEKGMNKMGVKQMLTCGLLADKINDEKMVNNFINKIVTNFYDKDKGCIGQQNPDFVTNVYDVKNNGMFLILLNSNFKEN